jgi:hypothetical protein
MDIGTNIGLVKARNQISLQKHIHGLKASKEANIKRTATGQATDSQVSVQPPTRAHYTTPETARMHPPPNTVSGKFTSQGETSQQFRQNDIKAHIPLHSVSSVSPDDFEILSSQVVDAMSRINDMLKKVADSNERIIELAEMQASAIERMGANLCYNQDSIRNEIQCIHDATYTVKCSALRDIQCHDSGRLIPSSCEFILHGPMEKVDGSVYMHRRTFDANGDPMYDRVPVEVDGVPTVSLAPQ